MHKIKPYYDGAFDIFSFFRDRKSTGNFLKYLFEQSIEFSKLIEGNGNTKPFPIQYESERYTYQIDYQFMIYVLGKWVAKQTGDDAKLERVLRDFAITIHALNQPTIKKNIRFLAIFLGETISIFTNRDRDKDTPIDYYPAFNQKILEFEDEYYDYKVVGINRHQMKYFVEDWEEYMKDNEDYFFQNIATQVAFGKYKVDAFWAKLKRDGTQKKRFYFGINDTDYLEGVDKIWERNSKD